MTFTFHRQPRAVQLEGFERYKHAAYFALWFDPRVGKTKVIYDIFQYRYDRGDVDTLIILSFPSGVKYVWQEEISKDFHPKILDKTEFVLWYSGITASKARRQSLLDFRTHDGPLIISMNCEAVSTKHGFNYIEWLLAKRKVMLVLDEAAWAARWSTRTKKILTLGGWFKRGSAKGQRDGLVIRATLDGTPVDEGPYDIYYPSEFLKPGLLGHDTLTTFKAHYTEYDETIDAETGTRKRLNHTTGSLYDVPIGYRNLDELRKRMATFGYRVRRADVSDAPPKVYQSVFFELTPKQRQVYDKLRDQYVAELSGKHIPVQHVLKRMTRLQMIARNYFPPETTSRPCPECFGEAFTDEGDECERCHGIGYALFQSDLERIDSRNPAVDALVEAAKTIDGAFVVWCRFRQDANDVALALAEHDVFLYTGDVEEKMREQHYLDFKAGKGRAIVATVRGGLGRGKDLSRASASIYYTNEFSRRYRTQTEDRTETITRGFSTSIMDLIAADTKDLHVIDRLRNKGDIAAEIMGDPKPEGWM